MKIEMQDKKSIFLNPLPRVSPRQTFPKLHFPDPHGTLANEGPGRTQASWEQGHMQNPYPRDLAGYGRSPPDPRWPGGARIAVSFVLNYEEGAEMNVLHGDPTSEA